jgi:hypothetical protein
MDQEYSTRSTKKRERKKGIKDTNKGKKEREEKKKAMY